MSAYNHELKVRTYLKHAAEFTLNVEKRVKAVVVDDTYFVIHTVDGESRGSAITRTKILAEIKHCDDVVAVPRYAIVHMLGIPQSSHYHHNHYFSPSRSSIISTSLSLSLSSSSSHIVMLPNKTMRF